MKKAGFVLVCFGIVAAICGGCGAGNSDQVSPEALNKLKDIKPGYTADQRMDIRKRMMGGVGVQKPAGAQPPAAGQ